MSHKTRPVDVSLAGATVTALDSRHVAPTSSDSAALDSAPGWSSRVVTAVEDVGASTSRCACDVAAGIVR